ncbi:hypothetical protein, partial [Leptospira fainei]|uniref:hypothetical protein n=1 Tax=Leptospira fainei TaxID=48782 RepID=UPI0005873F64
EHENIKAEVEKLNPSDVRLTKDNCRSSASPKDLARDLPCKTSDKAEFGEAQARSRSDPEAPRQFLVIRS